MPQFDHDKLEKIILLIWDNPKNFNDSNTQRKIGKELFKDVRLIQSLQDFEGFVAGVDAGQEFLFLIHLDHNDGNNGPYTFRNSKIMKSFPGLRTTVISSAPRAKIYEKEDSQLDVITYDGFHAKIGSSLLPQVKGDLAQAAIVVPTEKTTRSKEGIFLSHSSADKLLVGKFRDLILEAGLGYDINNIKFTSAEDHGIAAGENIPEDLRMFMNVRMGLFIQFVSDSYEKSRVCLNEEGAGWCLMDDLYFVTVFQPPFKSSNLGWVKNLNKAIDLRNRESLLNFYENRKPFFPKANLTRYSTKVDEFLDFMKTAKVV